MTSRVSQMGTSGGGGSNLGKIAKNCMKITKSAFLGQNSGASKWGGGKQMFWVVGEYTPSLPPTRGNPAKYLFK